MAVVAAQLIAGLPPNIFPVAFDDEFYSKVCVRQDQLRAYPYFNPNTHTYVNVLIVERDKPGYEDELAELTRLGVPPNVIVENLSNGHTHWQWYLQEGVGRYGKKLMRWVRKILADLTRICRGDTAYNQNWTRNPLYEGKNVRTHAIIDCLYDLKQFLDCHQETNREVVRPASFMGTTTRHTQTRDERVKSSRNWDGFYQCLDWAKNNYNLMRTSTPDEWERDCIHAGEGLHADIAALQKDHAYDIAEIRRAARNVARWTYANYRPREKVLTFADDVGERERQQAGQAYTVTVRTKRLQDAIRAYRQEHPDANKSEVARALDCSRPTVRKWWSVTVPQSVPQVGLPVIKQAPLSQSRESPKLPPPGRPQRRNGDASGFWTPSFGFIGRPCHLELDPNIKPTPTIKIKERMKAAMERVQAKKVADLRRLEEQMNNCAAVGAASEASVFQDIQNGNFDAIDTWLIIQGQPPRTPEQRREQIEFGRHWPRISWH
jgi:hypothetical protein